MNRLRSTIAGILFLTFLAACSPDDNPSGNPGYDGPADNTATTIANSPATTSGGYN